MFNQQEVQKIIASAFLNCCEKYGGAHVIFNSHLNQARKELSRK